MKLLRFQGYSDDTFGLINDSTDDYDNSASGKPIEWLLQSGNDYMIVFGQHCPGNVHSWLIGVGAWSPSLNNDPPLPGWPVRIFRDNADRFAHNPILEVEAPDDVQVSCLQRHGDDE